MGAEGVCLGSILMPSRSTWKKNLYCRLTDKEVLLNNEKDVYFAY